MGGEACHKTQQSDFDGRALHTRENWFPQPVFWPLYVIQDIRVLHYRIPDKKASFKKFSHRVYVVSLKLMFAYTHTYMYIYSLAYEKWTLC